MLNELSNDELCCLESLFYEPLKKSLKVGKKSVFLKFFQVTNGTMNQSISSSSVSSLDLFDFSSYLQKFLLEGYIVESTKPETYIITPKGVWAVESHTHILDLDLLFSYLENKYFQFTTKDLDEKSKIALFSLISMGAFCKETLFFINGDELSKEKAQEVYFNSYKFLIEMGVVSPGIEFGSSNEGVLHFEFRHLKDLNTNTKGLYNNNKNYGYWVSVYDSESKEINIDHLSYLFWQIFKSQINWEKRVEIEKFCNQQLSDYITYIFNRDQLNLHYSRQYGNGNIISDALFKLNEKSELFNSI